VQLEKNKTRPQWRKLDCIRPFIDCFIRLAEPEDITQKIINALPPQEKLAGAIVRLVVEYPREWEALIDDASVRDYLGESFEFHLVKRPQADLRIRLPEDQSIGSLSHLELLEKYLEAIHIDRQEGDELLKLAEGIVKEE
jgi:DNA repair protein SbcD/Mre11